MLRSNYGSGFVEAGCDEAGRGCLAGPVFAAAVILPEEYTNNDLNDSKQLTEKQRNILKGIIENDALSWAVARVDNQEIDRINILNASILAMHRAIKNLTVQPGMLLIDGNRFKPFQDIPFTCIIKGDGLYLPIAAASVLAKTYRDEYMKRLSCEFPFYGWDENKGYPTLAHRKSIVDHGLSPYHRLSFSMQLRLW